MSNLKSRLVKAEERLALEARDEVLHIYPLRYAEETEEAYQERLSANEALPHKTVKYPGGLTITFPAGFMGGASE